MADLPIVMGPAGAQPRAPAEINATLLATVEAQQPGYTARLPGILIEDIASTDTAAIVQIDSAMVETINSLTPLGANEFLLAQLGQMLGIPLGEATNTSVYVQFEGLPGFVIGAGFLVSDGTYQYRVVDGGICQTDGLTPLLFAVATQEGTWAVPPDTVTTLVTQPPTGYTLTVNNPTAGVPSVGAESATSYRSRVLQANRAASQGMASYLRTLVCRVPGVQPRLVSPRMRDDGGWTIIAGGGDPYAVAYAIWQAIFDVSTIYGSLLVATDITADLPGVVTTELNHGYSDGDDIEISDSNPNDYDGELVVLEVLTNTTFSLGKRFDAQNIDSMSWAANEATLTFLTPHGVTVGTTFTVVGCDPTGYNGTFVAITGTTSTDLVYALLSDPGASVTEGQLSAGVALYDTSGFAAYVSGAVLTPNLRNITASVNSYPDTYPITFINPPQQVVAVAFTWNTDAPNFVSAAAVAQLGIPAIVEYVNSVSVGQPINLFRLQDAFQAAVAPVLPPDYLTRMVASVSIDGVGTPPISGTGIIEGDPESYFYCEASDVTVTQG